MFRFIFSFTFACLFVCSSRRGLDCLLYNLSCLLNNLVSHFFESSSFRAVVFVELLEDFRQSS